jgi:hypothetical protein
MWQWLQDALGPILAVVGTVAVGGGVITGFAFWLFKQFGEKWLGNKFAERLAAFRHEQSKEMEQVKFEINKLMDRKTKLHQREFEVLPKAWSLLTKNYHSARAFTSYFQSYPDVERMGDAQLEDFLRDSPLRDWQKEELRAAPDKNKYYQEAIFWHRLSEARTANRKSGIYLLRYGIFMRPEMKEKFTRIDTLAFKAIGEAEINRSDKIIPRLDADHKKFWSEGEELMKELETEVQKRLWE